MSLVAPVEARSSQGGGPEAAGALPGTGLVAVASPLCQRQEII